MVKGLETMSSRCLEERGIFSQEIRGARVRKSVWRRAHSV